MDKELTLCLLGNFACFFLPSALFASFKINFFEKFFQEYHQVVKQFWIQIRPDILLGLIWVQTVCKSYQQQIVNTLKPTECSHLSEMDESKVLGVFFKIQSLIEYPVSKQWRPQSEATN